MEHDFNEASGVVERASSGVHQTVDKVSDALRPGVQQLAAPSSTQDDHATSPASMEQRSRRDRLRYCSTKDGRRTAHDQDDDGFAEAVDRLTRALQSGSFEVPADSDPGWPRSACGGSRGAPVP